MFHLAVVLESGRRCGGLDTQDVAEFVVDLDRGLTETMLDAGALDPRRELLPISWRVGSDLVAEKVATCSALTSDGSTSNENGWRRTPLAVHTDPKKRTKLKPEAI